MKTLAILALGTLMLGSGCKTTTSTVKEVERVDLDKDGERITLRFSINKQNELSVRICHSNCEDDKSARYIMLSKYPHLIFNQVMALPGAYVTKQWGTTEPMQSIVDLGQAKFKMRKLEDEKNILGEYFGKSNEEELEKQREIERNLTIRLRNASQFSYQEIQTGMNSLVDEMRDYEVKAVYSPEKELGTTADNGLKAKLLNAIIDYVKDNNDNFKGTLERLGFGESKMIFKVEPKQYET